MTTRKFVGMKPNLKILGGKSHLKEKGPWRSIAFTERQP
jgi:hypothetical protein